jgi:hypothetical protein
MKQKQTQRYSLIVATVSLWVLWFFDLSNGPGTSFLYKIFLIPPLLATFFLLRDIYMRGWFPEPLPMTHTFHNPSDKKIILFVLVGIIIFSIYTIYVYRDQLMWLVG